jgi:hypothetical protein
MGQVEGQGESCFFIHPVSRQSWHKGRSPSRKEIPVPLHFEYKEEFQGGVMTKRDGVVSRLD